MRINKNSLLNIYIPALLFLIAFVWKFFYIGARDVCIDEPFTIFNAQRSLKDILLLPAHNEPNPPLFMVLLHFWIKIFGISPYSVRIIPLLFNAATAVFMYFLGRKIMNYQSGIIAAGLFILSSYQFYFGMETRTYSLLLFATSSALYFLFSIIKDPKSRKFLVGLVISNIILVYSHYFGWFVVLMEGATLLFYLKRKGILKSATIAIGTTAIAFIPMASIIIKQFLISKDHTWVRPPESSKYWEEITSFMNSPHVITTIMYVLIAGIILFAINKTKKKFPFEIALLFLFWIVPYSIMFFVSAKVPMFENRYVMYNSIGLYLFIGTLIGYLFEKYKFLLLLAVAIVLFTMESKLQTQKEFIAHREVKKAVNYLKEKTGPNYVTIIYPHWADYGFAYYYDRNIFRDIDNFEEHLRSKDIYQVWGLDDVKRFTAKYPDRKIAFFKDGGDGYVEIENYLDSAYVRTDSTFFADCFRIFLYTRNDTLSAKSN